MLDFDKAGPDDPDASTAWAQLLYGATMSGVQHMEHSLALLSLVVTTDPHERRESSIRDQLPALFDRWWRAYQKDSAGRTLRKIEGKIPDDLYGDLEAFIRRRNWFAHRFFIEQIEQGEDGRGRFARGTVAKLVEVYADATKLTERVDACSAEIRAAWPEASEEPPPEFIQWVQDFSQLVRRRRVRAEVWADMQASRDGRERKE
jgi:hypothetical protein